MKTKWRGIQTTQVRKNEKKAKTVNNRFKQKTFSLARIDDKKRWSGYPGNTGISRKLSKHIPDCLYYVEPFAGTAKVYQAYLQRRIKESKHRKLKPYSAILNDKSNFVYNWLKKELNYGIIITNADFVNCIKIWDSKRTFFLLDPPWYQTYYDQSFSCFNRKSVTEYDEQILSLCTGIPYKNFNKKGYKIKGKFIITTRKENKIMLRSRFNKYLIKSEYVVCGKYPKVLLITNLKLKGLKHAR
jgi:hypothetical protein